MKAIRLKTEYLTEPLGLGNPAPRFFWNCEGGEAAVAPSDSWHEVVVQITSSAQTNTSRRNDHGDELCLCYEGRGRLDLLEMRLG